MSVSKASDITSLRVRDRNNPKIITARVIRNSPPHENYIFLTCEVNDDNNSGKQKHFTLKIRKNSGRLNEFADVKIGDFISFSHTKRNPEPHNNYNYKPGKFDLNVELIFEKHSKLHEKCGNLDISTFSEFDKLSAGMSVTIVGQSLYDSQNREKYQVLSVTDINDSIIEVKYLFDLKVKCEQKVIMT
uniref:Uncharacterized protein n=1 Tax=Panagrolaimus davidi TaxID=227884 RepID=A0A914P7B4_9BILA